MKLTGDDSPLVADFVRSRKKAELRIELASLRKALDDRRTVEGWTAKRIPWLSAEAITMDGRKPLVVLNDNFEHTNRKFEGDTFDEAFSSAAEWVRGQS
jgi:hypothetical protein